MVSREPTATRASRYLALQPPPEVRRELATVMAGLGMRDAVPHVTMVAPPEFPANDAWLDEVRAVAGATAPFLVRLGEVASFDARVRYLSVEGEGVTQLRGALEAALGLAPRAAPFVAHLTLALARGDRPLPEVDARAIPARTRRPFLATDLGLFTRPVPGAPYARTRTFRLTGGP